MQNAVDERLKKFRTRWLRWLGQKTRWDKSTWVTLLDCNYSGWASKVLEKHGFSSVKDLSIQSSRGDIKKYYELAIYEADMQDLMRLDSLYCQDIIESRGL